MTRCTPRPAAHFRWRSCGPVGRDPVEALQSLAQLTPRRDRQLGEDLAQVPLDGARAQEEASTDLGVRQTGSHHHCDLTLLRSQLVVDREATCSPADCLAGCQKLSTRSFGESLHTDRLEDVVRLPQRVTGILVPPAPSQPLT